MTPTPRKRISDDTRRKMRHAALVRIKKYPHTLIGGWNKGLTMTKPIPNWMDV